MTMMTMMLTFSPSHAQADKSLYDYDNETDDSDDNDDNDSEDNCDE